MRATTSLIFTPTGQSTTQPGLAQEMQREASVNASAATMPRFTSSKLRLRTAGSRSGMWVRSIFILSFNGRVFFSDIMSFLGGQLCAKLRKFLFLVFSEVLQ